MVPWISSILTLGEVFQSHVQHTAELEQSHEQHHTQIDVSYEIHDQQMNQNQEIHNIQHSHNLESAGREGLRDLWAQYNQKNQTSIIFITLLYSCCFVILVEGELPSNVSLETILIYSLVISVQIISLTISLILLLKIQSRMTQFNIFDREHIYNCGLTHSTFESYYQHHCHKLKIHSIRLCNVGLISIYISGIILWSCKVKFIYNSTEIMSVFIVINMIGLILIFLTLRI